jgi:geranylgeranyl transferase type-1 subunit beta
MIGRAWTKRKLSTFWKTVWYWKLKKNCLFNNDLFFCWKKKTYEGAFGQNPEAEAHGGSTFCAVASLYLMNYLNRLSEAQLDRLKCWCLNRQTTGFNGRVNKPWDTCYSFWVGSTLKILDFLQFSSHKENIGYIFETYNGITGG